MLSVEDIAKWDDRGLKILARGSEPCDPMVVDKFSRIVVNWHTGIIRPSEAEPAGVQSTDFSRTVPLAFDTLTVRHIARLKSVLCTPAYMNPFHFEVSINCSIKLSISSMLADGSKPIAGGD